MDIQHPVSYTHLADLILTFEVVMRKLTEKEG